MMVLIATIVFKRPKTTRYGVLRTLLTQVMDFLEARSGRIGPDAARGGRLNLLNPKVCADVDKMQREILLIWRENVQSGARRTSEAPGTPRYPHIHGEESEEDDGKAAMERLVSEASGLEASVTEEEPSSAPAEAPPKPSPPARVLLPATPESMAQLRKFLSTNRSIATMPGPGAVGLAASLATGLGLDVPRDELAELVNELKQ